MFTRVYRGTYTYFCGEQHNFQLDQKSAPKQSKKASRSRQQNISKMKLDLTEN